MTKSEDKTLINVKLLIHDFNKTPNGWGITEDTANNHMKTLVNKPIKAKYYSEDDNDGVDFLGDHEPNATKLRKSEEYIPTTDTDAIGVINEVYIDYIDGENESLGKAIWANGVLWLAENINTCNLLYEWHSNNIRILTSVEWFYSQSVTDSDGTQWIADPIYSALCVLNSEAKGEQPVIYGNYETANLSLVLNQKQYSQFENALESDFSNRIENNEKENENMEKENIFLKHLNDISLGDTISDISQGIYDAMEKVMSAEEYRGFYVCSWSIYDTYFIYDTYVDGKWKYHKVDYKEDSKGVVTVNYEGKKEVKREDLWVEVAQFNLLNAKVTKLEGEAIEDKAISDGLSEDIAKLNSQLEVANNTIEELEPFKVKLEEDEAEELLNEKLEYYEEKFVAVDNKVEFDTEDVQTLIKNTLSMDETESLKAKLALSEMLVNMVKVKEVEEVPATKQKKQHRELNSKLENLIPTSSGFVDNYGFKI